VPRSIFFSLREMVISATGASGPCQRWRANIHDEELRVHLCRNAMQAKFERGKGSLYYLKQFLQVRVWKKFAASRLTRKEIRYVLHENLRRIS
jgi:hypothetical protein